MKFTRRDFGRLAVPAVAAAAFPRIAMSLVQQSSKIDGVQIGAITYSFRQGVDKKTLPAVLQSIGLSETELMSGDAEIIAGLPAAGAPGFGPGGGPRTPAGEVAMAPNGCAVTSPSGRDSAMKAGQALPAGGPGGRTRGPLTPEQEAAQKKIADWRMAANAATWKGVRKQFSDAGVDVQILCYNMNVNTKDDEIDYAFQMARDLGVRAMSCSTTVAVAKRVAPFADKYKIMWGGHGHANIFDDEEFAKPETFKEIMSFSKYIGVNLDIGHFTAAGYDAVAYIPQIHDRIANIHLKDRTKPDKCYNSANVVWGTGQTPVKEVLQLMKKNKYTFPANIEYEYATPAGSDSIAEVKKCYEYVKKCLS
jgi:sugar phosphate isomerase/epimerase